MAKVCVKELKVRIAQEVAYRSISEKQGIQHTDAVSSLEEFTGENRADITCTPDDQDVLDIPVRSSGFARNGI